MAVETRSDKLELVGGRLCLDFTNTVGGRFVAQPNERLTSYLELVMWGRHAGIVSGDEAEGLLEAAERMPGEAASVLRRAIALREAIYRLFSRSAVGLAPLEGDLARLNEELSDAMQRLRVHRDEDGYSLAWERGDRLDRMLWPIARSAMEVLTSSDLERVRECGGEDCNWLFLDTSKNHSRRWCVMSDCGNRAKAKRHYHREKGGKVAATTG